MQSGGADGDGGGDDDESQFQRRLTEGQRSASGGDRGGSSDEGNVAINRVLDFYNTATAGVIYAISEDIKTGQG